MNAGRRLAAGSLLLTIAAVSFADRGMIPLDPKAKIFEPTQRALIAWNGEEEVLVLSTDMRATKETKVLEVLPLPSEPQVKKGDIKAFVRATEIINRRLGLQRTKGLFTMGAEARGARPAGEVTFHEKIGPHDVSVTRVNDATGFVEWVTDYLGKQGIREAQISPEFRKLVEAYLADDFKWFVFDVVELKKELKTVTPIQYRFKTEELFYPLRITRLAEGRTRIELIVMTTRLLRHFPGLSMERVRLLHNPFRISKEEMAHIAPDIAKLFSGQDRAYLRIWQCEGLLAEFHADLIARERAPAVAKR
jgi:hypothetical protein